MLATTPIPRTVAQPPIGPIQHGQTLGHTQHGPTQHGPTQHGPTQHGPTHHGPTQHGPTHHGGAYVPHPTEPTPPFAVPVVLGGSLPPGVPVASHPPTNVSSVYPPPPSVASAAYPAPAARSVPPPAYPAAPAAYAVPPATYPSPPATYVPTAAVAGHTAPPAPGTVRWGVLGAVGAAMVLGLGLAVIAGWMLFGARTPQTPPPRPDPLVTVPQPTQPQPTQPQPTQPQPTQPQQPQPTPTQPQPTAEDAGPANVPEPTDPRPRHEPSVRPPVEAPASEPWPDGARRRFSGAWAGEGWRYRLLIDLERRGGVVTGSIRWTLAETPDELYVARVGETATEQVRGTFAPPGLITLDGQSVTDDSLISADHYELHLAEDGSLVGVAREGGGRLTAHVLP
jgi:hypothetical protein